MLFVVLALVFLVLPIAELALIFTVADAIGGLETFVLLVAVALLGSYLMKRAGLGVLRRISERTARGEVPTDEVVDGGLVLAAGALMLTPGFLTDIVGILFLLPPTRALFRPGIKRWAERKVRAKVSVLSGTAFTDGGFAQGGFDAEGAYIDVDGYDRPSDRPRGDDPQGPPALPR
jgi:UPF0716 protein FxsA